MAISVRPINHHDQVSVFDHLEELRGRLIVSVAVLAIAFAFAFWQSHAILKVLNRPLADAGTPSLTDSSAPLTQTTGTQKKLDAALDSQRVAFGLLAASAGPLTVTQREALASAAHADATYLAASSPPPAGVRPITLGIGEPFSQTVIVSAYLALLLALPVILWQVYAFITPAFTPGERRVATPLLTLAPLLFALGLAFGYYVVLPGAVTFLLHFNATSFDALVQARSYYQFILFTMLATGLFFEIPIAVLGLNQPESSAPANSANTAATPSWRSPPSRSCYPAATPSPPSWNWPPCSPSTSSASSPPPCSSTATGDGCAGRRTRSQPVARPVPPLDARTTRETSPRATRPSTTRQGHHPLPARHPSGSRQHKRKPRDIHSTDSRKNHVVPLPAQPVASGAAAGCVPLLL